MYYLVFGAANPGINGRPYPAVRTSTSSPDNPYR